MANRPEPEIDITPEVVRALLDDQFPALCDLELRPLSRGWDNTNMRLGNDLIVRVPHRQASAPLIVSEQRWLPQLAAQIDLAIPAPTHAGRPTADFPWHWSVTPFASGAEAANAELIDPAASAELLGVFFHQLHVAAPVDAPRNPYRGCPLTDRADRFIANLSHATTTHDKTRIERAFHEANAAALSTRRVWLHGDLHARNMIVDDGRLTSVIDWGDICAGDPATDLAGAFMLVPDHVSIVAQHVGATAADWERARGWAVYFAIVYLAHSDDDPVMGAMGSRLLDAVFAS